MRKTSYFFILCILIVPCCATPEIFNKGTSVESSNDDSGTFLKSKESRIIAKRCLLIGAFSSMICSYFFYGQKSAVASLGFFTLSTILSVSARIVDDERIAANNGYLGFGSYMRELMYDDLISD